MIRFPSLKEPSGHSTRDAGNGSQRVREGAVKPSSELVVAQTRVGAAEKERMDLRLFEEVELM